MLIVICKSLLQPVAADRCGLDCAAKARDEWSAFRDCRLHGGELERLLVACCAVPYFGNPKGVLIRAIGRDHITQTARHRLTAREQNRRQRVALTRGGNDLSDSSVHRSSLQSHRRARQERPEYRGRGQRHEPPPGNREQPVTCISHVSTTSFRCKFAALLNSCNYARAKPNRLSGRERYRTPVAAKMALVRAGITVTGPTSPTPPSGRAPLSMK